MDIEEFVTGAGICIMGALLVFFLAIFSGTIVWILWDNVIPYVFPGLVEAGTLAKDLTWLQAVGLTWLSAILIKSSSNSSSNKE